MQAPSVFVALEEIVIADGRVEQIALCDARWAMVVIPGTWRGDAQQARGELVGLAFIVGGAGNSNRHANQVGRRGFIPVAGQSRLKLLVRGEGKGHRVVVTGFVPAGIPLSTNATAGCPFSVAGRPSGP